MKPTLPMLVLLIALGASAQDVEPTLDRALASLVRELVAELPYRVPNGEALAIEAEPSADRKIVDALGSKLLAEGFRLQAGGQPAAGAVPIRISTREAERLGTIRVTAGDYVAERRFGRASWVDRPRHRAAILVVGSPSESADASLRSAREKLSAELRDRFPALARVPEFERYASRQPTSVFVAERSFVGRKHYEAYLMAEPSFERLQRAERALLRAERRTPWVKASALAVAACVLWLLYLRADFRTRGFRTGRLRLLFGSLFAALSFGLWSLPL